MTVKRPRKTRDAEPPPIFFEEFALQKALYDEYRLDPHGLPKRGNGRLFIVDARGLGDFAANGDLYSFFCSIHVEVLNNDEIKVTLAGNIPDGSRVREWQTRHSLIRDPFLEFAVKRKEQGMLGELASAMLSIVERGAPRYSVPSYKYVCPRTASCLERLKAVLDRAWASAPASLPPAKS